MESAVRRLQREALLIRILWMLLYAMAWQLASPLLLAVVLLQVVWRLVRGKPHPGLARLGGGLGGFLAQIARFGCFQSEDKPWPVADWPAQTRHEHMESQA